MTDLLQAEFVDENGASRGLGRQELLTYLEVISGAGNETTNRLIGWTAKVLAEHPDQRREIVEDAALIPNAIEEILRFEPPAHHMARVVARDVPNSSAAPSLRGASSSSWSARPTGTTGDIPTVTASTSTARSAAP